MHPASALSRCAGQTRQTRGPRYGAARLLHLNRYGINDRTPVAYNADGSLELLLQPEAPKDEDPLKANWLPTGQGGFHLFLRIYCPDRARIDGGWKAPSLIPTAE